jgi:hypothetical protein
MDHDELGVAELGVALAVAHLAELHRQADRRRPASHIAGRTQGRHRDRAPGSPRLLDRGAQAAECAVAAGGLGRGTEEGAMLVGHQHKPGVSGAAILLAAVAMLTG